MFRNWHPLPNSLMGSGEGASFDLLGEYRDSRRFVEEIKRAREATGLTLVGVSRRVRYRSDGPISQGKRAQQEPDTGNALALRRRSRAALVRTAEAIRDTRPARGKATRVGAAQGEVEPAVLTCGHELIVPRIVRASGSLPRVERPSSAAGSRGRTR